MFVSRSQLAAVELERDEWRLRAESVRARPRTRTEVVFKRTPLWARLTLASWLVLLGLLAGGVAVPRANDRPTLVDDYPACISATRESSLPATSEYRELVRALYACGVFDGP